VEKRSRYLLEQAEIGLWDSGMGTSIPPQNSAVPWLGRGECTM